MKQLDSLNKRELFAAMAMQGLVGGKELSQRIISEIAAIAVAQADALLAELAKEKFEP